MSSAIASSMNVVGVEISSVTKLGLAVGYCVGFLVGFRVGFKVGFVTGFAVGFLVTGLTLGLAVVGLAVGSLAMLLAGAGVTGFAIMHLEGGFDDIRQICCSIQAISPETRE